MSAKRYAPGRLPTTVDQSRDLIASVPSDTLADLRDRAMIALASDDVELRDVQQALGHSQITTTERYVHQSNRLQGLPEKAVNDAVFTPLES